MSKQLKTIIWQYQVNLDTDKSYYKIVSAKKMAQQLLRTLSALAEDSG